MLVICLTCQSAIFIKKFIENRRDQQIPIIKVISLSLNEDDQTAAANNPNAAACFNVNNQRWNNQVFSMFGNCTVIIILLFMSTSFVLLNSLLSGSNITTEEKAQIDDHLNEITVQIMVPCLVYVKNSKLRQHVKYELFN